MRRGGVAKITGTERSHGEAECSLTFKNPLREVQGA